MTGSGSSQLFNATRGGTAQEGRLARSSNLAGYCRGSRQPIEQCVASKLISLLFILPSLPLSSTESGLAQRRREEKRQKLAERRDELRQLLHEEQLSYEVVQA